MLTHEPQVLPSQASANQNEESQTRVEQPLIVERNGEKLTWRLQAKSARQEEGVMILQDPTLELFTEQQEVVRIVSEKAWFEPLQRNIEFKGHVQAFYRDWQLKSDVLKYRSVQDQLTVPGRFELESPETQVHGRGLRANRQTQEIFISHETWIRDSGNRDLSHDL